MLFTTLLFSLLVSPTRMRGDGQRATTITTTTKAKEKLKKHFYWYESLKF